MAKRSAGTQLTKDGESDGEGDSDEQISTPAQIAARKRAKPRGIRRPGIPSQNMNGGQQQQQTSQSFPPFGGGSNSTFGSQLTAPGFNFSTQPTSNPFVIPETVAQMKKRLPFQFRDKFFATHDEMRKYEVKYERNLARSKNDEPQFAAHAPFLPGNQESITEDPSQPQPAAHVPFMIGNQEYPRHLWSQSQLTTAQPAIASHPSSNVFSQPTVQQEQMTSNDSAITSSPTAASQPPSNLFSQPSVQQQQMTSNDSAITFDPTVASQSPSNLFLQPSFQQQQMTSNDSAITFDPTVASQPPSNLFSQPSFQQQQMTSNDSAIIFGPTAASQPPSNLFSQPSFQQQQMTSNVFAPQRSARSTADLFAHIQQTQPQAPDRSDEDVSMRSNSPDNQSISGSFRSLNVSNDPSNVAMQTSPSKFANGPGASGSLFERIARPTINASYQSQSAPTNDAGSQGVGGSLSDRITKPTTESSIQFPSGPSNDDSSMTGYASFSPSMTRPTAQANLQSSANQGTSNPFKFPNVSNTSGVFKPPSENSQPAHPQSSANQGTSTPFKFPSVSNTSGVVTPPAESLQLAKKTLFGQTLPPQPSQSSSSSPSENPQPAHLQSSANQGTSSPFKFPSVSTTSGVFKPPSENSQPAKKKLFGQTLPPQPSQSSSSPKPSTISPTKTPDFSQSADDSAQNKGATVQHVSKNPQTASKKKRKGGTPPDAPNDFTEEEQRQLITGYRLRCLDVGLRNRIRTDTPDSELILLKKYHAEKAKAILKAKGGPIEGPKLGSKRKATNDQIETQALEKKAKFGGSPHVSQDAPPNGSSSENSQTSSMFKNILDNRDPQHTFTGLSNAKPSPASSNVFQSPTTSSKNSTASVSSSSHTLSSSANLTSTTSANPFSIKPSASNAQTFNTPTFGTSASTTPASSDIFNPKSIPANKDLADATRFTPGPKIPTFSVGTPSTSTGFNPFVVKPAVDSAAPSSAPQAPAIKVPTFGGSAAPNFLAQFGKAAAKTEAELKNERKRKDYDSEEEDEGVWERRDEEEQRAKRLKYDEIQKTKVQEVPTFGGSAAPNFLAQFGTAAAKTEAERKNERKRKDYDSDEEDEAVWERRDEEEQRAKRLKYNEIQKTMVEPSVFDQPRAPLPDDHNIFGHLSADNSGAEGNKIGDADDEDEEHDEEEHDDRDNNGQEDEEDKGNGEHDEEDEEEDEVPRGRSPPRNASGLSFFDRISRDAKGNPIREIPKADAESAPQQTAPFGNAYSAFGSNAKSSGFATSNSFGKPAASALGSTSNDVSSSASPSSFNPLGKQPLPKSTSEATKTGGSPTGDHTWKADSPIRFGAQNDTPAVNITSPSPSKQPLGGLFGSPKPSTTAEPSSKPTPSIFASTPAKASIGLGFKFTPANAAASSLAPPSNTASTGTSRATSPGLTTGESANESNADNDEDHAPKEDQLDLTSGGPGEEDEDVIFTVKTKAMIFNRETKGWNIKGLGPLRVLKNRETGVTRVVMRQDPSGNVVLNSCLLDGVNYESPQSNHVRVPIATQSGIESWTLKVAQDGDAKKLARVLSENQPN